MFSQVSVSHSVHGGGDSEYLVPGPFWGMSMAQGVGMSRRGVGYVQEGVGMSKGDVYVWVGYSCNLLTPSDSHYMYGRQAGGTHPTGMLSCIYICSQHKYI